MVMRNIRHIRRAWMRLGLTWTFMNMFGASLAFAAEGHTNVVPGIGLLRGIGIASALGGFVLLILVHHVYRKSGEVELRAKLSLVVRPGMVFATMHSAKHLVNYVTHDVYDPFSKQPAYKRCAVSVREKTV